MRKPIIITAMAVTVILFTNACNNQAQEQKQETISTAPQEDPVKRGEYLVSITGCNDCHSPKRMGPNGPEIIPELMLSGYPGDAKIPPLDANATKNGWVSLWADLTTAVGPWGQSYAANITSDSTGIGMWTEEQFKKALTQGKFKGIDNNRPMLPPMPWFNYITMKEEDLQAVFAYLKSTKPAKNVVPPARINPQPKM